MHQHSLDYSNVLHTKKNKLFSEVSSNVLHTKKNKLFSEVSLLQHHSQNILLDAFIFKSVKDRFAFCLNNQYLQ